MCRISAQYGDPNVLVGLAVEAEQAGWDGFFVWDHILHRRDRAGGGRRPVGDAGGVRGADGADQARDDDHAAGAPAAVEGGA